MKMTLDTIKKLYFLGIGGIGMSALARYFNSRGIEIHGYDKTPTPLTKTLTAEGMIIHYEEDIDQIPEGVDLVIYTPAVPKSHQEYQFFEKKGIPIKKRAEVLGLISRSQRTIAIAGTHGKTSTTTILTHLLKAGGIDCTAFLGGISENYGSNYVAGQSDWVVVEADEYDRSFLHLTPDIAVILSMDADHLEIYGDHQNMLQTGFNEFVKNVKPDGTILVQHELAQLFDNQQVETFGVDDGDFRAMRVGVVEGGFHFDFTQGRKSHYLTRVNPHFWTPLPGRHNVENALAAMAVATKLGVDMVDLRRGLRSFKGIKRRFEFIIREEEMVFINDYAHHPTELTATITAAKELFPNKKITGIFQPHLYSRTRDFQDDFAVALDLLDDCLLLDIYPARETPIEGVTSEIIFDKMQLKQKKLVSKDTLLDILANKEIEVLLLLGAGDIVDFVDPVKKMLQKS